MDEKQKEISKAFEEMTLKMIRDVLHAGIGQYDADQIKEIRKCVKYFTRDY